MIETRNGRNRKPSEPEVIGTGSDRNIVGTGNDRNTELEDDITEITSAETEQVFRKNEEWVSYSGRDKLLV